MHSLPRRHGANARFADEDPGAQSHRARPAKARGPLRDGEEHQPLWSRPDRAQPGAEHAALLPERIHGAAPEGYLRADRLRRGRVPRWSSAPHPVLSTLRFFRSEYTELLQKDTYGPNGYGGAKKSAAPTPQAETRN